METNPLGSSEVVSEGGSEMGILRRRSDENMEQDRVTFGGYLRWKRSLADWTMGDLARYLECSVEKVSAHEHDEIDPFSEETLDELCREWKIDPQPLRIRRTKHFVKKVEDAMKASIDGSAMMTYHPSNAQEIARLSRFLSNNGHEVSIHPSGEREAGAPMKAVSVICFQKGRRND